jgi:tryptophan synthase alpha chain
MTIADTFTRLRERGEMALMPYCLAGYPTLPRSLEVMRLLANCGADLIEVGVPFSDPVADGVTIQGASQVALDTGFRLQDLLGSLAEQPLPCPAILMSYLNPLLAYGIDTLLADLTRAGISGLIIPDLPIDEAADWLAAARAHGVAMVFLVTPTTSDARMRRIAEQCDGFVYVVAVAGTTGIRDLPLSWLPDYLSRVRRSTGKPIALGFGISEPIHVRAFRGLVDGVIVGSRFVQAIERNEDLSALFHSLKTPTRSSPCSS